MWVFRWKRYFGADKNCLVWMRRANSTLTDTHSAPAPHVWEEQIGGGAASLFGNDLVCLRSLCYSRLAVFPCVCVRVCVCVCVCVCVWVFLGIFKFDYPPISSQEYDFNCLQFFFFFLQPPVIPLTLLSLSFFLANSRASEAESHTPSQIGVPSHTNNISTTNTRHFSAVRAVHPPVQLPPRLSVRGSAARSAGRAHRSWWILIARRAAAEPGGTAGCQLPDWSDESTIRAAGEGTSRLFEGALGIGVHHY